MKQIIRVQIEVEFPDEAMEADVREALPDAVVSLKKMLPLIPALRGKSSKGKIVPFTVKDVRTE